MFQVDVSARSIGPFVELVGAERVESVARRAEATRALLGSQAVWNLNSTPVGGGVAEMLRSLLRYACGLGVDVRWAVIEGPPEFFAITKRIHNALHDAPGDGSPLGPAEAELFEKVAAENVRQLDRLVRPGDIVICHDPQTAGLVPHLAERKLRGVWRCHIGHEGRGRHVDEGWAFLRPYLDAVPLAVFSRDAYAPPWLPRMRAITLPPNIDPFSVKNQWMPEVTVHAILSTIGLIADTHPPTGAVFVRDDGTTGHVLRQPKVLRTGGPPDWQTPLIVQVSRWDRMKDHIGVLRGFERLVANAPELDVELVLAGPAMGAVADDPEAPQVLDEIEQAYLGLPEAARRRVHLVLFPMDDPDENAAMVNALQRHATIVVQKSLREGFGLTVTEAMWKRRPVVASAVGGIKDQIRDGVEGLLIHDPTNPEETARALQRILEEPELAVRLGRGAYERVHERYLSIAALERWADLVRTLLEAEQRANGFAPPPELMSASTPEPQPASR